MSANVQDRIVVGIDVAKDRIDVATDPPHRVLSVATDKDGLRQLKEYLQSYDVALVVVESTDQMCLSPIARTPDRPAHVAAISGFNTRSAGNREKSRSAV